MRAWKRVLKDVRLVPNLKRNLIFVGMLDDQGFLVKVENGIMKICKGYMVVTKCRKSNEIYPLEGATMTNTKACVSSKHENETKIWHKRLGHACKVKFETGKKNTKGLLSYIHNDLWGPSRITSHSRSRRRKKRLRTDNGLEYCSDEFDVLCKNEGILSQAGSDHMKIEAPGTKLEVVPLERVETEMPIDHGSDDSEDDSGSDDLKGYTVARDMI
uniref:GAG-pre-integrase domain-containing protein n=1 Tax=Cannabis sativa TaxID=3483 RepID=A0A803PEB6_CANSA